MAQHFHDSIHVLNCSIKINSTISENVTLADLRTRNSAIVGSWLSLAVEVIFLLLIIFSKIFPCKKEYYHWLSMDHVINFAVLCLVQTSTALASAPFNYSSVLIPSDNACLLQGCIRNFSTFGILMETFFIPFLAYQIIVLSKSFEMVNKQYRIIGLCSVYGVAVIFAVVPALVQFGSEFNGTKLYVYQPVPMQST